MRYLNMLLAVLMVVFVAVQYNDPDGPLWMAIYLVPAAWAAMAAFRLPRLQSPAALGLLAASLVAGLFTLVHYWPTAAEFWRMEIWWEDEAAREGMGVMVGFAVLLIVLVSVLRGRTAPPAAK